MIGGHKCIQEVGNYAPFFDLIFGSRVVRHGEGRGRETAPMVEGGSMAVYSSDSLFSLDVAWVVLRTPRSLRSVQTLILILGFLFTGF